VNKQRIVAITFFSLMGLVSVTAGSLNKKEKIHQQEAKSTIEAKSGSEVEGEIKLWATKEGVKIKGLIKNLDPNSKHGFHVHEQGDCSGKGAKSAGGHFNPDGHKHGSRQHKLSHLGDLGNIEADKKGEASFELFVKGANLDQIKRSHSFMARAFIIHKQKDDISSQPSGNAGMRIGCGVIGLP